MFFFGKLTKLDLWDLKIVKIDCFVILELIRQHLYVWCENSTICL